MARYRDAIDWLLFNDATEWLDDGHDASLSVTASLVADLFGKTASQVRADLLEQRSKIDLIERLAAIPTGARQ